MEPKDLKAIFEYFDGHYSELKGEIKQLNIKVDNLQISVDNLAKMVKDFH